MAIIRGTTAAASLKPDQHGIDDVAAFAAIIRGTTAAASLKPDWDSGQPLALWDIIRGTTAAASLKPEET